MPWRPAQTDGARWGAPEERAGMNDALSTILESPGVERLATGFGFTEGPL
jgi:hypothetical protein